MSAPALRGFLGLGVLGEHGDADGLAGAVGQVDHATDHLVGVTRIDAQVHRDFDGLVELGLGALLDHLHGFVERVELLAVDAFAGGVSALSDLVPLLSPPPGCPWNGRSRRSWSWPASTS